MERDDFSKEKGIQPGIYLSGSQSSVVLAAGDRCYQFPSENYVTPAEIDSIGLRAPSPSERENLLACNETTAWLTKKVPKGPLEKDVVDSFIMGN